MINKYPSRFKEKINFTNSCWLWTAGKYGKGYGSYTLDGKNQSAHRVSWKFVYGEIPEGLCVLHKCDTPSCVNPDHLFLGTNQDNMDDKVSKGRQPRKESHWRSKLTQAQVDEIRKTFRHGKSGEFSGRSLAEKYGVTKHHIKLIAKNKSWAV